MGLKKAVSVLSVKMPMMTSIFDNIIRLNDPSLASFAEIFGMYSALGASHLPQSRPLWFQGGLTTVPVSIAQSAGEIIGVSLPATQLISCQRSFMTGD